jgi:hypothetical protein
MNYTLITLFGLGFFGIVVHNLNNMNKLNRQCDGEINLKKYFKLEMFTILLSACVVTVAVICSQEIKELAKAGKWLGLGMFAVGYMAQSLIISLDNKAEKFIKKQGEEDLKP